MATKGTPAYRFKMKPTKRQLKESYEVRLAAQFGGKKERDRLAAYNRRVRERKMNISKEEYCVDGKNLSRYQLMDYIVTQISEGSSLPEVCDIPGVPTMQTLYEWQDNHPDFSKALYRAEEIRGHRLGEKALEIAMKTDRENVQADKLKVETLAKAAARTNRRFQDKVVQENVSEYDSMSPDQIKARIQAMVAANPELAVLVPSQLASSLPVGTIEDASLEP